MRILIICIFCGFCSGSAFCECSDNYIPYTSTQISVAQLNIVEDRSTCGSTSAFCLLSCFDEIPLVAQLGGTDEYLATAFFDSTQWSGTKTDNASVDLGTDVVTIGCMIILRCVPFVDGKGVEHANKCVANDARSTCNEDRSMPMCTCSPEYMGDVCQIPVKALETVIDWLGTVTDKLLKGFEEGRTYDAIALDVIPTLFSFYPKYLRENMSWSVEEMIDAVVYEMDELDTRDVFTRIFDEVNGNCYTFNYANRTNDATGLFNVRFAGQYRDFSAMLKFVPDEQLTWTPSNAMVVYIHAPGTPPKQGLRYSIRAGASDIIALKKSITKLISNCMHSVSELNQSYYDDGEYTTEGCFSSCYQDRVFERCGCMDARFKKGDNFTHCTFKEEDCVANVTANEGEPSGWPECRCPQACYQEYYTMLATRGDFPLKGPACTNATDGCVDDNKEWARISIYMESLESEMLVEVSKSSFSNLLSQCGGLLGICLGLGVVGIIELINSRMMQSVTLLHLLATTALVAEPAPLVAGAAPKFDVLFINDFTLNFVNDGAKLAEKSTKCPGNAYPEAAEQFAFTCSVVDAIDASIKLLTLQYDFYNGGNGHHLNGDLFTKDNFAADAGQVFRNFCFEEPQTSDLPTYVKTKLVHARDVDVLVLFTAASAAELAAALPIDADDFKDVIVVGLSGADASSFYPSTFIAIDDFGHPEDVAGMINKAYADIRAA